MPLLAAKMRERMAIENFQTHGIGSMQILFQLPLSSICIAPNSSAVVYDSLRVICSATRTMDVQVWAIFMVLLSTQ